MRHILIGDNTVTIKKHHWAKQMSLKVARDGRITVTIPKRTPYKLGEAFARSKQNWIQKQLTTHPRTPRREATRAEKRQARELVEKKLMQWGPQVTLEWSKIRIGSQRTRWGSCSSTGTLSFNWRLIELPEELVDYVIVHELCHVKHMNHSQDFWRLVENYIADCQQRRKALRSFDKTIAEG